MGDVRPFLANVLRGRRVAPERVEEVAKHYEHFGGVSPLAAITRRQVEGLKAHLTARGLDVPVYLGMRNWHPLLPDTLKTMAQDGVRRAIGFVCAAHRSVFELHAVPGERRQCAACGCGSRAERCVGDVRGRLARSPSVHRGQRPARACGAGQASAAAQIGRPPRVHRAQHPGCHGGRGALSRAAPGVVAVGGRSARDSRLGAGVPEPQRPAGGSMARTGHLPVPAGGAGPQPHCGGDLSDRVCLRSRGSACTTWTSRPLTCAATSACRWRVRPR